MADKLNASGNLPCKIVYKVTAKTNTEISDVVREANYDKHCAGHHHLVPHLQSQQSVDQRLANLQKPYCHFATQYNREIPNEEIDMDFMNPEPGRPRRPRERLYRRPPPMPRKVIAGYWRDEDVQKRLGDWMRCRRECGGLEEN